MIRFVFFMLHDVSESNPDEAIVLPNTAASMRFNASLRLILFFCTHIMFENQYLYLCVAKIGYASQDVLTRTSDEITHISVFDFLIQISGLRDAGK